MKNVKNIINLKPFILVFLLVFTYSCDEDLVEINTDPLAATNIDPDLLFPQIYLAISQQRTIELNSVNIQAQQWSSGGSAGVFANPERYNISPNTTNNIWVGWFTTALRNLDQVKILTERNFPEANHIIAQAKVLEALTFMNLTEMYEDIPFSQATQVATFPNPEFDTQEEVLLGIIDRCNEAIELFEGPSTRIVEAADLMYKGDKDKWVKFANNIKLKALMLIANVNPTSVQSQLQELSIQPLILDNEDEARLSYTTAVGNENPIWRTLNQFAGGNNLFWFSGSTLVNLMNETNDPRRATYFDLNNNAQYVGQDQGVFSSTGISRVSLNIIRRDMPDRYATASETYFYFAEAALKGLIPGGAALADDLFRTGLQASLDSFDGVPGQIANADKNTFINSFPNLASVSTSEAIKIVNEQQYVDLFTRGIEAWTHWRRTKTPDFQQPVQAALSTIIRRYPYPASEISSNPNAPTQKPLTEPMWFEN